MSNAAPCCCGGDKAKAKRSAMWYKKIVDRADRLLDRHLAGTRGNGGHLGSSGHLWLTAMRNPRLRPHPPGREPSRGPDLHPVEELNDEVRRLPDAERLFAEVDEEYRQMEAHHAASQAADRFHRAGRRPRR